ncbi:MAG: hypothetical protein ABIJ30_10415 [bacterium]
MDKEKVKEKDGKVFSLGDVECKTFYINDNYKIECYPNEKISCSGYLRIGSLISCKKEEPKFTFRWDEKEEALDVDIDGVDSKTTEEFKHGKNGYEGHHSKRLESEGRVFELNIKVPNKNIFRGQITVPVKREKAFNENLHRSDEVTIRRF